MKKICYRSVPVVIGGNVKLEEVVLLSVVGRFDGGGDGNVGKPPGGVLDVRSEKEVSATVVVMIAAQRIWK